MNDYDYYYEKYAKFYSKRPKKELVDLIATYEAMYVMDTISKNWGRITTGGDLK